MAQRFTGAQDEGVNTLGLGRGRFLTAALLSRSPPAALVSGGLGFSSTQLICPSATRPRALSPSTWSHDHSPRWSRCPPDSTHHLGREPPAPVVRTARAWCLSPSVCLPPRGHPDRHRSPALRGERTLSRPSLATDGSRKAPLSFACLVGDVKAPETLERGVHCGGAGPAAIFWPLPLDPAGCLLLTADHFCPTASLSSSPLSPPFGFRFLPLPLRLLPQCLPIGTSAESQQAG